MSEFPGGPATTNNDEEFVEARRIEAWPNQPLQIAPVDVTLQGTPVAQTNVQGFWEYLQQRTDAISFRAYAEFIETVLCKGQPMPAGARPLPQLERTPLIHGVDAYQYLVAATEAFLLLHCGAIDASTPITSVVSKPVRFGGVALTSAQLNTKLDAYLTFPDKKSRSLPFLDRITSTLRRDVPTTNAENTIVNEEDQQVPKPEDKDRGLPIFCDDLDQKVVLPIAVELIWNYWHEEAMVVQAINALSLRFQNKRIGGDRDPLANLETHPLRPLANLLWGYIQADDQRLTVARRGYEYEHQYGLTLLGRAVPKLRPADRRSQFLSAFHSLLHQAAVFFDRSANLTIRADAFPLLNALRETHLVLSEGAHNQFRELPWTARVEMLVQQWLLARREVREFAGGRPAVPYAEDWMSPVDALRRAMGWGDTPVTHFNDLAVTGEKIVLSVRYADWSDRDASEEDAISWAVFWKPAIQRYIHSYKAVTGVDLSATTNVAAREIDATPPAVLLAHRIARARR